MEPIYAQGYYFISLQGDKWHFWEIINYYYFDEEAKLSVLTHRPFDYAIEVERVRENMQREIDEEDVRVNGEKVKVHVRQATLEFLAFAEIPYYTFVLEFEGPYKEGENCFENTFEEWVAEYDYEAYWLAPKGWAFTEVLTSCDYEVSEDGSVLSIWCRKGDKVRGYEKICWSPLKS